MQDFAVDAKDILLAASLTDPIGQYAATSGWGIFVSQYPDKPSTCISLRSTGGFPPSPQLYEDYPTCQVRIRGAKNGFDEAYAKALVVRDVLRSFRGEINGTNYSGIWAMTDITDLGQDESGRPLLTCNFRAIRGLPISDPR